MFKKVPRNQNTSARSRSASRRSDSNGDCSLAQCTPPSGDPLRIRRITAMRLIDTMNTTPTNAKIEFRNSDLIPKIRKTYSDSKNENPTNSKIEFRNTYSDLIVRKSENQISAIFFRLGPFGAAQKKSKSMVDRFPDGMFKPVSRHFPEKLTERVENRWKSLRFGQDLSGRGQGVQKTPPQIKNTC